MEEKKQEAKKKDSGFESKSGPIPGDAFENEIEYRERPPLSDEGLEELDRKLDELLRQSKEEKTEKDDEPA